MPPIKSHVAVADLSSRFACWALFANTYLLTSDNIHKIIPQNHYILIFPVIINIVAMVIFGRFKQNTLSRDMIDFSFYELLFYIVFIEAYFFNAPTYIFMVENLYHVFMPWLSLAAFTRLFWFAGTNNWTVNPVSPAVGILGLIDKRKSTYSRISMLIYYLSLAFALLVVYHTTFITSASLRFLLGTMGYVIIGIFGNAMINRVVVTVEAKNDAEERLHAMTAALGESAKVIEDLKKRLATEAIKQPVNSRSEAFAILDQTISPYEREILIAINVIAPEMREVLTDLIFNTAQDYFQPASPPALRLIKCQAEVLPQESTAIGG